MPSSVTLLLPSLSGWQHGLTPGSSYPALETLLARATLQVTRGGTPDQLRMCSFGYPLDHGQPVPVAALSYLSAVTGPETTPNQAWYLRLDPVTMQADMSCVRLMRSGFGHFPLDYRQSVSQTISHVLELEGLQARAVAADCWIISLPADPGVQFASLDDALGADVSDCLPRGEQGRYWKRLLNEIQMALHANADNQQRTERGEAVINSVWPWGGGLLPEPCEACELDCVFASDPVSQGLARLHGCELHDLAEWDGTQPDGRVLLDWVVSDNSMRLGPDRLEQISAALLNTLRQRPGSLRIQTPAGSWQVNSRQLRYFWKRRKPLDWQLQRLHSQQQVSQGNQPHDEPSP